jgi:hypothetical protein
LGRKLEAYATATEKGGNSELLLDLMAQFWIEMTDCKSPV